MLTDEGQVHLGSVRIHPTWTCDDTGRSLKGDLQVIAISDFPMRYGEDTIAVRRTAIRGVADPPASAHPGRSRSPHAAPLEMALDCRSSDRPPTLPTPEPSPSPRSVYPKRMSETPLPDLSSLIPRELAMELL